MDKIRSTKTSRNATTTATTTASTKLKSRGTELKRLASASGIRVASDLKSGAPAYTFFR